VIDCPRGIAIDVAPRVRRLPRDAQLLAAGLLPPPVTVDGPERCAGRGPLTADAGLQLAGVLLALCLRFAHRLLAGAHHALGHQATGGDRDARRRLEGLVDAVGFVLSHLRSLSSHQSRSRRACSERVCSVRGALLVHTPCCQLQHRIATSQQYNDVPQVCCHVTGVLSHRST